MFVHNTEMLFYTEILKIYLRKLRLINAVKIIYISHKLLNQ